LIGKNAILAEGIIIGYRNGFKEARKLPASVVEMNCPFAIIINTFAPLGCDIYAIISTL
jgi:hypothetical protein